MAVKTAFEVATNDQRIKDILKADSEYSYQFLYSLIKKAMEQGEIPKEEDPELLADYFISTWTGWYESYILHKEPAKIKKMAEYFIRQISR
jgi:TetR/AcrR family transcriptional repressor of nem operon